MLVWLRICAFMLLLGGVMSAQNSVSNIHFEQKGDSIELLLQTTQAYSEAPRLTQQEGYKGIILPNLQAPARNEKLKDFFLREIQIFNIDEKLYVLGVGDARSIKIDMSKSPQAIKLIFSKQEVPPSELEQLLDRPHAPRSSLPQSLPTPESTTAQALPNPLGKGAQSQAGADSKPSADSQTSGEGSIIPLPFKNDLGIETWRYVAVLAVMGALVIVLLFVKRYVAGRTQGRRASFGGYFARGKEGFDPSHIDIISQKQLDSKHKILTIESNGYRYLILLGEGGTTLIDRYPIPQSISAQEHLELNDQFAKLLEQKQDRLSKYLHKP